MIHWEEGEDSIGLPTWEGYVDCSHWGLFLLRITARYFIPGTTLIMMPPTS